MNTELYNRAMKTLNRVSDPFNYDDVVDHVSDACECMEEETDFRHEPLYPECEEVTNKLCEEFHIALPKRPWLEKEKQT